MCVVKSEFMLEVDAGYLNYIVCPAGGITHSFTWAPSVFPLWNTRWGALTGLSTIKDASSMNSAWVLIDLNFDLLFKCLQFFFDRLIFLSKYPRLYTTIYFCLENSLMFSRHLTLFFLCPVSWWVKRSIMLDYIQYCRFIFCWYYPKRNLKHA